MIVLATSLTLARNVSVDKQIKAYAGMHAEDQNLHRRRHKDMREQRKEYVLPCKLSSPASKQCEGAKLQTTTSTPGLQQLESSVKGVRLLVKLKCTPKHQRYKESPGWQYRALAIHQQLVKYTSSCLHVVININRFGFDALLVCLTDFGPDLSDNVCKMMEHTALPTLQVFLCVFQSLFNTTFLLSLSKKKKTGCMHANFVSKKVMVIDI